MIDLSGGDEGDQHDHGYKRLIRISAFRHPGRSRPSSMGLVDAGSISCCTDGDRVRSLYTP
jgi:hypothetical protein